MVRQDLVARQGSLAIAGFLVAADGAGLAGVVDILVRAEPAVPVANQEIRA